MFGQIIFSKLIKACESEWIPEEDVLLGERWSPPSPSASSKKNLKELIYQPRRMASSEVIENNQKYFSRPQVKK